MDRYGVGDPGAYPRPRGEARQALPVFLGGITHSKVVPTWNYLAVHAYGEIVFFDDRVPLRGHVSRLTDIHEDTRPDAWVVGDAPPDYIEKMLGGIVGFTLNIARPQGKWKMSRNRSGA